MLLGPTGMERQALTKRTPTPGHAAAEGAADGTAAEYPGQTHHHGPWCYDDEHQDVQHLADPDGTVGPTTAGTHGKTPPVAAGMQAADSMGADSMADNHAALGARRVQRTGADPARASPPGHRRRPTPCLRRAGRLEPTPCTHCAPSKIFGLGHLSKVKLAISWLPR
jgi:hypothetical protein